MPLPFLFLRYCNGGLRTVDIKQKECDVTDLAGYGAKNLRRICLEN